MYARYTSIIMPPTPGPSDGLTPWLLGAMLSLAGTLVVLLLGIIGFGLRRHAQRFDRMEDTYVTDTQLTEALAQVTKLVGERHEVNLRTLDRIEANQQRMLDSFDASVTRIFQKMDFNEERAARTRHDIRDHVNALALKTAVVEATLRQKIPTEKSNERTDCG
jgi:hypothetical protein